MLFWRNGASCDEVLVEGFGPLALWGEGIFDTLRIGDGRLFFAHHHLARTLRSASRIWGEDEARDARIGEAYRWLADASQSRGFDAARARVVVAPLSAVGDRFDVFAQVTEMPAPPGDADAESLRVGFSQLPHPGFLSWGKTTSAIWSRLVAQEAAGRGLDELLVGREGIWLEAGWSSLVWCLHGVWFAVDTDEGVLASTTLAALEEAGEAFYRSMPDRRELLQAEAIVLLSSWTLARGVAQLDSRVFEAPDAAARRFRRILLRAHAG